MNAPARAVCSMLFFMTSIGFAFGFDIPEADYPSLPSTAGSAEGFVPAGWGIEAQSLGDLNKDGRADLLLVLKQGDPRNVVANEPDSPGMPEVDANPRILAAAFALKKGGYELVLEDVDFVPRHEDPCIDDPFGFAEIADGALRVGLHYWANAGSWYTSDTSFSFRYLDKAFRLVAYSNYTTKRNTGQTWDLSLDYVARKARIAVGSFSNDEEKDKSYERPLPRANLKTIGEIGSGWDFYPEQSDLSWWGLEESDPALEEE
jgi:hypothetical protein